MRRLPLSFAVWFALVAWLALATSVAVAGPLGASGGAFAVRSGANGDGAVGSGAILGGGFIPMLATATAEPAASSHRWQTPAALAVVAVTMLALGWRVRANARRRRSGCGSDACAAVSPDVERLRARLSGKKDR